MIKGVKYDYKCNYYLFFHLIFNNDYAKKNVE